MLTTPRRHWTNWSGSVRCEPNHRSRPHTLEQIQSEVLRAAEDGERLRVVGNGHSFTPLCSTDENQMVLEHFAGIEAVDLDARRAWVRAGTTLRDLGSLLAAHGLALETAGDIDGQTLGGALATGHHGTGARFGILSSQVSALRLVGADGAVREARADHNPDLFDAARVSLGALGVVTHVELQCVDAHRLHFVVEPGTLEDTLANLPELNRAHRSFEFFWLPYAQATLLRCWDTTHEPVAPFNPLRLARELALDNGAYWVLSGMARHLPSAAERLTRRVATGATRVVRDSASAYGTRRYLRYDEMEYAIPAERVPDVLTRLESVVKGLSVPLDFPVEVRFARSDAIWLSPAHGRDTAFVSFRSLRGHPHDDCIAALTEVFDRYDGRPHWGKLHDKTAESLRPLYPRFDDFCRLRQQLDPRGVFLNPYLGSLFGVDGR